MDPRLVAAIENFKREDYVRDKNDTKFLGGPRKEFITEIIQNSVLQNDSFLGISDVASMAPEDSESEPQVKKYP